MLIVRMLKAKSLRQRHRLAVIHQANRWLTRLDAPDPLDRRAFW
jgi:hypothetical protein